MIKEIRGSQLIPHPDNRPLGINEEKVEQLAEMMRQNGYDQSKPIKARPHDGCYQIIEGEHRWRAARKAGIEALPVYVVELDDDEALIQLVAGNAQTESHALDYGYAALKVCEAHSKKGMSYAEFASRVGLSQSAMKRVVRAVKIRQHVEQWAPGGPLLTETKKLDEIYKCRQSDWLWFHNLVVEKSLSKIECQEISKRIRAIDDVAKSAADEVLNLTELKQESATAKERIFKEYLSLIEGIEDCAENLDEKWTLYRYDITNNEVVEYSHDALQNFKSRLKEIKDLTRQKVYNIYKTENDKKRQQTKENAEADAEYYRDKANQKEAEEQVRAEWEAFMPQHGKWYNVGRHWLYCGDNRDKAFLEGLPEKASFAFADPPYNAGVDEWDSGFKWEQDYLQDKADVVAVTPGGWAAIDLYRKTKMNYVWELACWIANGMTHGKIGYANWIKIALFAKEDVKVSLTQDFKKITIKTSETEETSHKGRKPYPLMKWLIGSFSKEGQTIIDPFAGSGTTLLTCEAIDRVCFTAEVNPVYCKEIIARFKELQNEQNTL